eukprot:22689-Amorphochlora_amoeboformis.AAC.1
MPNLKLEKKNLNPDTSRNPNPNPSLNPNPNPNHKIDIYGHKSQPKATSSTRGAKHGKSVTE